MFGLKVSNHCIHKTAHYSSRWLLLTSVSFTFQCSISSAVKHCSSDRWGSKCHFEMAEFVNLWTNSVQLLSTQFLPVSFQKVLIYCQESSNYECFIITTLTRINVLGEKKKTNRTLSICNGLLKFHYLLWKTTLDFRYSNINDKLLNFASWWDHY